jgi:multiple sugar transport system substrate-binding protein
MQQSGSRAALADLGFSDYGVAQVPVLDPLPPGGRDTQTMVAGINISVFADSDQQEPALELVEFLTSTDEQVTINKAYTTLPVVQDAYSDPAFTDEVSGVFATILRDHAEPMPQVPEEGQMETLVGGAVSDLLARAATGEQVGEAEVRAALTEAQEQMEAAG